MSDYDRIEALKRLGCGRMPTLPSCITNGPRLRKRMLERKRYRRKKQNV